MPVDTRALIVARARSCVGVPFRLHGRDRATGLDCIGLTGYCLDVENCRTGYRLRGDYRHEIEAALKDAGLRAVAEETAPGDILLLVPGPQQLHCAVRTDTGYIHADSMLRRVVEVPGAPQWATLSVWRLT